MSGFAGRWAGRLCRGFGLWLCAVALLATGAWAQAAQAQAGADGLPLRVQAVRSDWSAAAPPDEGWVEVTLPDDWSRRWPGFDGVVWYRLTFETADPMVERSLLVTTMNMAGEVRVNDITLARDPRLVEPLSHLWNLPRYFLLDSPLLRAGENVVLVRVSGLAAYGPGLGGVRIGDTASVRAAYDHEWWVRIGVPFFALTLSITLGLFFLMVWLMRPRETAYGWYVAAKVFWIAEQANLLGTGTTYGLASTDAYEKLLSICLLFSTACSMLFVLRFCERRWPWRERALWAVVALEVIVIAIAPHEAMRAAQNLAGLYGLCMALLISGLLNYFAWQRRGRFDQRVLAVGALITVYGYLHDSAALMGLIDTTTYIATYTALLNSVLMAVVLAWNFIASQRRIEGFNAELQHNVQDARAELAATLARQHELELTHARLGERVSLANDLHDGLGSMLVGDIAALEQAPAQVPSQDMLDNLRQLRDDLRLIIDTASAQDYGEHSLGDLVASLRHRMTQTLEAHGIAVRWEVDDLEQVYPGATRGLGILRILQEALANVLKHSQARHAHIRLRASADALTLSVSDDGAGFVADAQNVFGTGLRSMRVRAQRLDARFSVESRPGETIVRLVVPLAGREGEGVDR